MLAAVVIIVLGFATYAIYLEELYAPALEALGNPIQESAGFYVLGIVMSLIAGKLQARSRTAMPPPG